jgi:hypothetical protein
VAVAAALLGLAPSVSAQNLVGRSTSGKFGIKVGVISRMNMRGDRNLQSEIGSTAQVFADFPKGKGFYFSTAFDFYYVEINRSNQIMIEPSVGVKRVCRLKRSDMMLLPAASIGFAYLAEMGDLPSSNFLTYKLLVEIHLKIDARKAWVGELAFFNAPSGSNGRRDISFGPGLMLRCGLAFR